MKKLTKSLIAALTALIFAVSALPLSPAALRAEEAFALGFTVPDGYNAHDYSAVAAFLEIEDESGVKNGEKLGNGYDANDPATWEGNQWMTRFEWAEVDGELRINKINIGWNYLSGSPDFSDCTALEVLTASECGLSGLDISGCGAMRELWIGGNMITEIDLSSCPLLEQLWCDNMPLAAIDLSCCPNISFVTCNYTEVSSIDLTGCALLTDLSCENAPITELDLTDCAALSNLWAPNCALTALDVSHCPDMKYLSVQNNSIETLNISGCVELEQFDCSTNALAQIDISSCPLLNDFYCLANPITEFDLSNNPLLKLDHIGTVGEGTVGYYYNADYDYGNVSAAASGENSFIGWFDTSDPDGEPISTSVQINLKNFNYTDITAKFIAPVTLGDADENGKVTVTDAILIMRYLIESIDESELNLENSDADGNGTVELLDALIVLRMALDS